MLMNDAPIQEQAEDDLPGVTEIRTGTGIMPGYFINGFESLVALFHVGKTN